MIDVEKLSEIAFQIIAYAGTAKSLYIEAGTLASRGNFEDATKMLQKGDESFLEAHKAHKDIVVEEARSMQAQITLLLAHAEDQLMSAETIKLLIEQMIALHKSLLNVFK